MDLKTLLGKLEMRKKRQKIQKKDLKLINIMRINTKKQKTKAGYI
jgi:hypothetical protein